MDTTVPPAERPSGKVPRTERGRRTLRKLLDAAAVEFGEKGFHEASISGITLRAGTALGSFYTYFDSKDEIFRALVRDMSDRVRVEAGKSVDPEMMGLDIERAALVGFLTFASEHKEIYRIIDEAEFVDPAAHRKHYETTAERILGRLRAAADAGLVREDVSETDAWALMGMNVFLGLRYCIWDDGVDAEAVADRARALLEDGIGKRD
jgi:AcrR family transcriptional regulator